MIISFLEKTVEEKYIFASVDENKYMPLAYFVCDKYQNSSLRDLMLVRELIYFSKNRFNSIPSFCPEMDLKFKIFEVYIHFYNFNYLLDNSVYIQYTLASIAALHVHFVVTIFLLYIS